MRLLGLVVLALVACKDNAGPAGSGSAAPAKGSGAIAEGSGPARPVDAGAAQAIEDLPALLERVRAEHELPGIAAAVWKDGKEVVIAAVGKRAAGAAAVTVDDRWHLGSNTKAMTATLIGRYVERGVLRWNDTVAKLFRGEKVHPSYAKVTLEQLLRHEAGTPANPPAPIWLKLWADGAAPDARITAVRAVLAEQRPHDVGELLYSNTGYMIAGAALERATKKSWEQLMRDELFAPLGMTSCGFGAPTGDAPRGHDSDGDPIEPGPEADNPPGVGPAGTVHCSLRDYGKFLAVHAGTAQLVKPATLARLQDPAGKKFAMGWVVLDRDRGKTLVHNGSNTMWFASVMVVPSAKLAVAIVTNQAEDAIIEAFEPILDRYAQ